MPATATASHRILLADDDVHVRDAIAAALKMQGVDVTPAADGREALYVLRTEPRPCLILLDLDMPGMDGWEFRRRQLLWPQMASIPVVVVSGQSELKTVTRVMEAAAVLPKPVEFDHLLRAVEEHCGDGDPETRALRLRLSRTQPWSSASARRSPSPAFRPNHRGW